MKKLRKIQALALYIYFFSLNFEVFNLYGLGSTARFTGFLYLATIAPNLKEFLKTKKLKSFIIPILVFWLLLMLISLFNINAYSSSVFDVTMLLNIVLFLILVNHERTYNGILLKGFFTFALGSILLTLLYNAGIGVENQGGRVQIFGDNQNAIAIRLSIGIITLIYTLINNSLNFKKIRFVFLLPIPLMFKLLVETGSRVGLASVFMSFFVLVIFYKTKRKKWSKVVVVLFAIVISIYSIDLLMQSEVMMNRIIRSVEEGDLAGRDHIWSAIIPLIQDNFIFGVGKSGYVAHMINHYGRTASPHNVILEVMAYTGFIGLSIYLFFLYRVSWQAFKAYRIYNLLLPLVLLIPIFGLHLSGQALGSKIAWAIYAFAVSSVFQTNNYKSISKH